MEKDQIFTVAVSNKADELQQMCTDGHILVYNIKTTAKVQQNSLVYKRFLCLSFFSASNFDEQLRVKLDPILNFREILELKVYGLDAFSVTTAGKHEVELLIPPGSIIIFGVCK